MASEKYLYSVATGMVNPFLKRSRRAAEFMAKQEGFVAVHPAGEMGMLWLFDSLNNAKGARNLARAEGITCGKNICRFRWDGGDNLVLDDPEFDSKS